MCQSQMNDHIDSLNNCNNNYILALNYVYNLGVVFRNYQCVEDGLNFFCDAINFLCEVSTDNSSLLSEECVQIRDNQCLAEWRIVRNLFNASLPDCNTFNEGANLTVSDISSLPCPAHLDVFCGLCLPICGEQFPFNDSVETAFNAWKIILLIVSLSGGVVNLIVSIIKHKKM